MFLTNIGVGSMCFHWLHRNHKSYVLCHPVPYALLLSSHYPSPSYLA